MPVLGFPSLEVLEELQSTCLLRESEEAHPPSPLDEEGSMTCPRAQRLRAADPAAGVAQAAELRRGHHGDKAREASSMSSVGNGIDS